MPDHLLIRREQGFVWTIPPDRLDAEPVLIGQVCQTADGYTAHTVSGEELSDPPTGRVKFASLPVAVDRLAHTDPRVTRRPRDRVL